MNTKLPVLEYSTVAAVLGKRAQWAFRFRTPEGEILMESAPTFRSKAAAERGFVSLIKAVARNAYLVAYSDLKRERSGGDCNIRAARVPRNTGRLSSLMPPLHSRRHSL